MLDHGQTGVWDVLLVIGHQGLEEIIHLTNVNIENTGYVNISELFLLKL